MSIAVADKKADLAGPGIGNYEDLEKILPSDYASLLDPKETQKALAAVKRYIEDNLCKELNLIRVEVPLIVDAESGVNDMLDRDGSRTPVGFHISNDYGKHPHRGAGGAGRHQVEEDGAEAVRLRRGRRAGHRHARRAQGLLPRSRSQRLRRSVGLGEGASRQGRATSTISRTRSRSIWKVLKGAETYIQAEFPALKTDQYPNLPDELVFLHAEEILEMYPDLPRKQRETAILQKYPAVFIIGIGWTLADGYPHEMRAADYDDWVTETVAADGRPMHGLNGDILVWNPVTRRRHELSSMGIRVTKETLVQQLEMTGPDRLPEAALPPGDPRRQHPAVDRRRHRPVAHHHAAAPQGPPGRGQRHRLAEDPQGDVRARRTSS